MGDPNDDAALLCAVGEGGHGWRHRGWCVYDPTSSVGITAPGGLKPERLAQVGVLPQKVICHLLGRGGVRQGLAGTIPWPLMHTVKKVGSAG